MYVTQNTNGARPLRKQLIGISQDTYGRYTLSIKGVHSEGPPTLYKQLNKGDELLVRIEEDPQGNNDGLNERAPKYRISGINLNTIT